MEARNRFLTPLGTARASCPGSVFFLPGRRQSASLPVCRGGQVQMARKGFICEAVSEGALSPASAFFYCFPREPVKPACQFKSPGSLTLGLWGRGSRGGAAVLTGPPLTHN